MRGSRWRSITNGGTSAALVIWVILSAKDELGERGRSLTEQGWIQRKLLGLSRVSWAYCGYHLATISGKILVVKFAIFDGKTALPNWNSLKKQRIDLCL
jgi:hypothetical protein